LAEHAGPERRQAAPPARASEELATAAPHGQALNARAEARLGPAAQLLNGARAGAASAAQRTVIPEGEFAKKGKMADALRLLIAAIATDEVAGALYRDAEKDGSDLRFTTGKIEGDAYGVTTIELGNTPLNKVDAFAELVGSNPDAVNEKLTVHIRVDPDQLLAAASGESPMDGLQVLAHEYGLHATRNFKFIGQLRALKSGQAEFVRNEYGKGGSMAPEQHHKEYVNRTHHEYKATREAILEQLGSKSSAFLASEDIDRQAHATHISMLEGTKLPSSLVDVSPITFKPKRKQQSTAKEPLLPKPDSSSKDCCFITTACMRAAGLGDDCDELVTLRWFRDNVMLRFEEGRALGALYYRIAPGIVRSIDESGRAAPIYRRLYGVIRNCVDAVRREDYLFALRTYVGMVLLLMHRFPEAESGAGARSQAEPSSRG